MAGRSVWGLAALFLAVSVKSLDAPPPELLENLEFFKSMDLLMDNEQDAPAEAKSPQPAGEEKKHASPTRR